MNDQLSLFKSKQAEIPIDDPPKYVTAAFLSAIWGISKKQVSNLKVKGVIPSDGENKYNLIECGVAYNTYIKKGQATKKTEMEAAKLEKIERENMIAAASLISMSYVSQFVMGLASITNQGLDALVPRATSELMGVAGESDIQVILFEQVRLIRVNIANRVKEWELMDANTEKDKSSS